MNFEQKAIDAFALLAVVGKDSRIDPLELF